MASMGVRKGDRTVLRLGLIALLMSPSPDFRDTLTVFPLFYDAMRRLSIEESGFLESIRLTIGDVLIVPFLEFLKRSPQNKTIQCMGYTAGCDADGFRYVRNW